MDYDAVNTDLCQGIVGGETAEARLVHGLILAIRVILLQKVKELFRGGLLIFCPLKEISFLCILVRFLIGYV